MLRSLAAGKCPWCARMRRPTRASCSATNTPSALGNQGKGCGGFAQKVRSAHKVGSLHKKLDEIFYRKIDTVARILRSIETGQVIASILPVPTFSCSGEYTMFGPGEYVPDPTERMVDIEDLPRPQLVAYSRNHDPTPCPRGDHLASRHKSGQRPLHDLGAVSTGCPVALLVTDSSHYCSQCRKHF